MGVRLAFRVAMGGTGLGGAGLSDGHDEAAVLDAFEPDETAGELLDARGFSVDDEDLEAGIVIEMGMAGGNDEIVAGVLKFGEFFGDAVGVVVVDEGDGADHGGVGGLGPLGDEAVANEITERLGAVRIAEAGDKVIKALEEVGIEGNSDSAKDAHGHSLGREWLFRGILESSTMVRFVARLLQPEYYEVENGVMTGVTRGDGPQRLDFESGSCHSSPYRFRS
jgi:hypothetical protein